MRFHFEDCVLDLDRREIARGGGPVHVEPQVFDLLAYLIRNSHRVVSRDELLATVWNGRIVSESTLASRINAARSAIGDNGGEQRLIKTSPRRGIRFVGKVWRAEDAPDRFPAPWPEGMPRADKPLVSVLPFANIAGGDGLAPLIAGLVEDVSSALAQFSWLSVRAPGVLAGPCDGHYRLEGSMRAAGSRVRIIARLIDVASETLIWANRIDGELGDNFELQDRLTAGVVGAIAPRLERAEIERAGRASVETLDAHGCTLRGMGHLYEWTRGGVGEALRLFQRAIEIDPHFALAHGMAAYCFVQRKSYGWFSDRDAETEEADRLARRAAALAGNDAFALSKAAHAIAYVAGDVDCGAAFIERALVLNPHLAAAWYVRGWIGNFLGRPDEANRDLAHALQLNSADPFSFKIHAAISYAHFFAGRYEDASAAAEVALRAHPDYLTGMRGAIASHALAGRPEAARRLLAGMQLGKPGLRLSNLTDQFPLRRAGDLSRWSDALQIAGVPE